MEVLQIIVLVEIIVLFAITIFSAIKGSGVFMPVTFGQKIKEVFFLTIKNAVA